MTHTSFHMDFFFLALLLLLLLLLCIPRHDVLYEANYKAPLD